MYGGAYLTGLIEAGRPAGRGVEQLRNQCGVRNDHRLQLARGRVSQVRAMEQQSASGKAKHQSLCWTAQRIVSWSAC